MSANVNRSVDVVRAVVDGVRSDQVTFIAASLAYYAFISLIPLLLLALTISTLIGLDVAIEGALVDALGPEAAAPLVAALTSPAGQGGATAVGLLVLVWSGLKLFRGLDVAFSTVYPAEPGGFLDQLRDAAITLLAVAGGIAVTVLIGVVIALPNVELVVAGIDVVGLVGTLATLAGLSLVFLPLYYLLPEADVTVREAAPGAVFAALGWTLLQLGFGIYASTASTSAYGVIGGALLLVTFLYFGGLVLLVGLVLNAVLAGRTDESTDLDEFDHTPMPDDDSRTTAPFTDSTVSPGDASSPPADDGGDGDGGPETTGVGDSPRDDQELEAQVERLRQQLREFERSVDDRTVHRDDLEADLQRYVRRKVRRGKARGWGPYLVLAYGTAMTLGAFFFIDSGLFAVIAMLVIWLSTLGLYVIFLVVGLGLGAAGVPGRLYERVRGFRQ